MFRKVFLFVILMSIFGFKSARSQSEEIDLNRIVVTPSRVEEEQGSTPAKVDVITQKEVQSSASFDLSDPLTRLPGVNVSNYGGLGSSKSVRMRGSTAAQVLVMVDGRPINSPRDGEVDLSTIPLDNIERVEVMHGPGSSLYGSSAMGGTVNILTKNPPKEGQKTEFFSSFGTFRTYNERLSQGAKIGDFGYLLNAGYQYSNGSRENSKFDSRDLNAKLEYALNNENSLNLNTGMFQSKAGAPGSTAFMDIDDKQNNLKNFQVLNWDFTPDESLDFSVKTYNNYDRLEFVENTPGFWWDTANKKDVHATNSLGLNTQISKKFTDIFQSTGGFNYVANNNDSTATGKHKYIVRAGYLENHFQVLQSLKINLQGRVDDYSNFGTQPTWNFGGVYNFRENNALRFSMARSFRAPTFNDLYWPNTGMEEGNPNLRPEKGLSKEIALDVQPFKNLSSSLAYFRNDFKNLIVWSPDEAYFYTPANVNKARIDGVEWANKLKLIQGLDLDLNYTFLRAIDKNSRKNLVYQPRNKVDAAFKYHNIAGFACELTGQFTDYRFADAANSDYIKKFYIYGLNLSQKINQNITGYLWLNNIFNRKYQVIKDYPEPGFSVTAGIKATF